MLTDSVVEGSASDEEIEEEGVAWPRKKKRTVDQHSSEDGRNVKNATKNPTYRIYCA